MARKTLEEKKGEQLTVWLTPSTKKILDEARGNIPRSTALRLVVDYVAKFPGYIEQVLGTQHKVPEKILQEPSS